MILFFSRLGTTKAWRRCVIRLERSRGGSAVLGEDMLLVNLCSDQEVHRLVLPGLASQTRRKTLGGLNFRFSTTAHH